MRPLPFLFLVVLRLLVFAAPASAQSDGDFAAWSALIRSPIAGVLSAPEIGHSESAPRSAVTLTRGTWSFGAGDDERTNIAAALQYPSGRMSLMLNGMISSVQDCTSCRGISLGGGLSYALNSVPLGKADGARLDIAVQPLANFTVLSESLTALTAALSVPVSLSVPIGPVTLRPFLTPGYGYGRLSANGESDGGTRALLGYGVAVANRSGTLQAHIGTMEVRLEDAPTVTAMGLTLRY